jgi:hypothetical protein
MIPDGGWHKLTGRAKEGPSLQAFGTGGESLFDDPEEQQHLESCRCGLDEMTKYGDDLSNMCSERS